MQRLLTITRQLLATAATDGSTQTTRQQQQEKNATAVNTTPSVAPLRFESDGRIISPYQPLDLPVETMHDHLFNKWKSGSYGELSALTDAVTGVTLNYNTLYNHVIALANSFYHYAGIRKGTVVAIYAPNHLLYPVVGYAVSMLGGITAFINPSYTATELLHHVTDSTATVLITVDKLLPTVQSIAEKTPNVKQIYTFPQQNDAAAAAPSQPQQPQRHTTIQQLIDQGYQLSKIAPSSTAFNNQPIFPDPQIEPKNDIAILPYSSGTTGIAKGSYRSTEAAFSNLLTAACYIGQTTPHTNAPHDAMRRTTRFNTNYGIGVSLSHHNIVSNMCQYSDGRYFDVSQRGERVIALLPLYHIMGQCVTLDGGLRNGNHLILMAQFEPQLFCSTVQRYKVQRMSLVPPLVNFLNSSPITEKYDFSSVEYVVVGAAPLSAESEYRFVQKFPGVTLRQGFGMSEASPVTHGHLKGNIVKGSVGKLFPNMIGMLVDVDTGKVVTKTGTANRGEMWLKGPNVMKGYWRNPTATQQTIDSEGYLHTGDIAYVDEEGNWFVVDRLKELIKVKGLQVAPAELEGILLSHPEIEDAAVTPVPDERSGELPQAWVNLSAESKLTENEIKQFVAKQVARHKRLDGGVVILRGGERIPKSPSGKILRRVLRTRALQEIAAK